MKNLILAALVALLAIFTSSSPANASFVTLNGGSSWGGWSSVGNSKTSGTWVLGSMGTGVLDRTYNIYSTSFVLNAGQTASGTGNNTASLFSGSWQAGDRIVGLGIEYTGTSRGQDFYFHRDTGAVNIKAATSYGAGDGMLSFDVGDSSSYINNNSYPGLVRQYSVFNGYSANGGSNFITPWGTGGHNLQMPVRSFTVQDMSNTNKSKSVQFLMNIDAILRSNGGETYGEGSFGSTLRLGFMELEAGGGVSQQVFAVQAVPEPGASAVLCLGLASFASRFRRRQGS
ncbi:MAG: PEP-CTERM sorting domain-containing protein [Planctomycetota bacterium]|jgi:hypothetical protein